MHVRFYYWVAILYHNHSPLNYALITHNFTVTPSGIKQ